MERILIGVAWPYANGTIHLGHLAGSLLPPDIFRRYNILKGNETIMVSGSDQHGTPITVTADKENVSPLEIAEKFHSINKKAIEDMDIDFSLFTKTHTDDHMLLVQRIFLELLEKDLLYKKQTLQYFCPTCNKFLPDRYVEGKCPSCSELGARGDQCDKCGKVFETGDLLEPVCTHCGSTPEVRETEHFFLRLSVFQNDLLDYLKNKEWWRSNVLSFTRNWLEGGLKDRAITRDMDWGIPVPLEGWEGKVIYVWFDAVIGYLSASKKYSEMIGDEDLWRKYWRDADAKHYYFLGKDNIPFHSIVWPAILLGCGGLDLPYDIPANEYLMFKGGKLSKSRGGSIDIPSMLDKYDPDVIRYYLSVNMPDTHDSEFSWDDFQAKVNNELVSTLGNFYHRCLSFTKKNFDTIPKITDPEKHGKVEKMIKRCSKEYTEYMDSCDFKKAMRMVMELAHCGNKFFDSTKPWALVKTDKESCGSMMNANLRVVKALVMMAWPFLPRSSEKIWDMLGMDIPLKDSRLEDITEPLKEGQMLKDPIPVYKKVEFEDDPKDGKKKDPAVQKNVPSEDVSVEDNEQFADFRRLDIRVGEVLDADDHPDAEKLFVLKVNVGEERQIVAGLKSYYSKDQIKGRKVLVVYNLKPAKLRGVRSEGMLLAADDEENGGTDVMLLRPSMNVPNGTRMNCGFRTREGRIEYKEFQKAVMKVVAVKDGKVSAEGKTADVDSDLNCIAVVVDDDVIPLTDGNGCYATVDGQMDGANIR